MSLDNFARQFFTLLNTTTSKQLFTRGGDPYYEGAAAALKFSVTSGSPLPAYPFWVLSDWKILRKLPNI